MKTSELIKMIPNRQLQELYKKYPLDYLYICSEEIEKDIDEAKRQERERVIDKMREWVVRNYGSYMVLERFLDKLQKEE